MALAVGVDIGGTKIEIIALDEHGSEVLRRRQPSPRGSYEATMAAVQDMVDAAERELGDRCTLGICHPGAISPATGLIKNSNSTWLNGQPLDRDLIERLGRPIAFANDANCLAMSEAVDGAGADAEVVFPVIIGTGCGGDTAVRRHVLRGANAIAGEWGHNALPWPADDERPGPACYCGLHGCVETWLSGPGLAASHRARTGDDIAAAGIAEAADQGDSQAEQTLGAYEDRLARALANVINIVDPDVIVLGGGVSNIARIYHNVPKIWGRYIFSDRVDTALRKSLHGDSSGVRGAAWLGRDMARCD